MIAVAGTEGDQRMRKLSVLLQVCLLLAVTSVAASDVEIRSDWRLLADTEEMPGQIARPIMNPADTSWISFEVRSEAEVQLYVLNLQTRQKRRVTPPLSSGEFDDGPIGQAPIDRDLAWMPILGRGGKLWAAFVSNQTGNLELYLYEALADEYYMLKPTYDSVGISRKSGPSWSEDGSCLTYTVTTSGDANIAIIRNMPEVLKNPVSPDVAKSHSRIVTGEGDQFGAVWCPVPNSGYFLYNNVPEGQHTCEVMAFDAIRGKSYGFEEGYPNIGYFAPTWNPNGTEIAFYLYDVSGGLVSADDEPKGDKYGLGLASIDTRGDSLVIDPKVGGARFSRTVEYVAPNIDRYLGPAWLPDGRRLLVSLYDERTQNPLRSVYPYEWMLASAKRDWLGLVGDGDFAFPRDVGIVKQSVVFSYSQGQKRTLLFGRLKPKASYETPLDYLPIRKERQLEWKDYAIDKRPGFLAKTWRFLMRPVAGSDIGINRGVVPVASIAGLIAYLATRGEDTPPPGHRNWDPPDFPDPLTKAGWIGISVRF